MIFFIESCDSEGHIIGRTQIVYISRKHNVNEHILGLICQIIINITGIEWKHETAINCQGYSNVVTECTDANSHIKDISCTSPCRSFNVISFVLFMRNTNIGILGHVLCVFEKAVPSLVAIHGI